MPLAKLYEVMLPDTGFSLETLNDAKRNQDFYSTRCQIGLEAMSNPHAHQLLVGDMFSFLKWSGEPTSARRKGADKLNV